MLSKPAVSTGLLGYNVANDIFAENSYYLRNALVRANYTNIPAGVHPTLIYLERFFYNLLLGEDNELKSRFLRVGLQDEPAARTILEAGIDTSPAVLTETALALAVTR